MLVVKREYHGQIMKIYQSEGHKIKIQVKYEEYKLRTLKGSSMLYHNMKFEQLNQIMKINQKLRLPEGKTPIIINITTYLKLAQRN